MILTRQEFEDCFGGTVESLIRKMTLSGDPWLVVSFGTRTIPFSITDVNSDTAVLTPELDTAKMMEHLNGLSNKL